MAIEQNKRSYADIRDLAASEIQAVLDGNDLYPLAPIAGGEFMGSAVGPVLSHSGVVGVDSELGASICSSLEFERIVVGIAIGVAADSEHNRYTAPACSLAVDTYISQPMWTTFFGEH